jgi:hypothetical protein
VLTFLTLLLGIVSGPRAIALNAPPDTASIELLLDGERVGLRRAPPWEFVVDFGSTPAPHHLDAIARNARLAGIGRARQRVNFPGPAAEAALALLPGKGGTGRVARLAWESVVAARPEKVTVTFDGKPLAAPNSERIDLPPFVPEQLHFLRAVADFKTGVSATAEITFGGRARDETEKELTAFPVRVPGGELPAPEAMDGWFLANGAPLRVVATEEGDPSIVVVLDTFGQSAFERMQAAQKLSIATGTFHGAPSVRTLLAYPNLILGSQTTYDVFPRSYPASTKRGLLAILADVFVRSPPQNGPACPRLADAVAVAALSVAEFSHPRAVVLVLTGNPDASIRSARDVRSYLSDLGVPLVVWLTGPAAPAAALDWGGGVEVKNRAALRAAVKSLDAALDEQRIVWVEGAHLPPVDRRLPEGRLRSRARALTAAAGLPTVPA